MAPKRDWRKMPKVHAKPKYTGNKGRAAAFQKQQKVEYQQARGRAIAEAKHADNLLARLLERKRFYALLRNKYPPQSGLSPNEIKQLKKNLKNPKFPLNTPQKREADIKRRVEAMESIQATEDWCRDIVVEGTQAMEVEVGEESNDDQCEEEEEEDDDDDEDDWGYEEEAEENYEENSEADDRSGWLNPGYTITDHDHDYSDLDDSDEDKDDDNSGGEPDELEDQDTLDLSHVDDQGDMDMMDEAGTKILSSASAREKKQVRWADESQPEMETHSTSEEEDTGRTKRPRR